MTSAKAFWDVMGEMWDCSFTSKGRRQLRELKKVEKHIKAIQNNRSSFSYPFHPKLNENKSFKLNKTESEFRKKRWMRSGLIGGVFFIIGAQPPHTLRKIPFLRHTSIYTLGLASFVWGCSVAFATFSISDLTFVRELYNLNIGQSCIERRFMLWSLNPEHKYLQNNKYQNQIDLFNDIKNGTINDSNYVNGIYNYIVEEDRQSHDPRDTLNLNQVDENVKNKTQTL